MKMRKKLQRDTARGQTYRSMILSLVFFVQTKAYIDEIYQMLFFIIFRWYIICYEYSSYNCNALLYCDE